MKAMLSSPLLTHSQPKGLQKLSSYLSYISTAEVLKWQKLRKSIIWNLIYLNKTETILISFRTHQQKQRIYPQPREALFMALQLLQFSSLHTEYFWPHWKMISSYICKNIFKRSATFSLEVRVSHSSEETPQLVFTRLLYTHPIQLTPCCKQNQGPLSLDSPSSSLGEKLAFTGSHRAVLPFQEQAASTAFPARDSRTHNTALAKAHFHQHEEPMWRDGPCHYSIIKELCIQQSR